MTAFSNDAPSSAFKSCPRCLLIAHSEATRCRKCGHEFHTSLIAPAPSPDLSENYLHRTHMFTLPQFVPKPSTEVDIAAANYHAKQEFALLARQTARRRKRRVRAYLLFGLLTVIVGLLAWLATLH